MFRKMEGCSICSVAAEPELVRARENDLDVFINDILGPASNDSRMINELQMEVSTSTSVVDILTEAISIPNELIKSMEP